MEQSRGIILKSVKYNGNMNIVTLYTEQYGIKSYVHYPNKKNKVLITPLHQIAFVAQKKKGSLLTINEIELDEVYLEIGKHPIKNAVSFFLCEVIHEILKEEEHNQDLYDFMSLSLNHFDEDVHYGNFHLWFLLKISSFLGLFPKAEKHFPYFDLEEGEFTPVKPKHNYFLQEELAAKMMLLINADVSNYNEIVLNRKQRRELTNAIIHFYKLHLNHFLEPKSLPVLETVLD